MELGNFLGKLKGTEKEEPKKFLALVLTDEVVQAALWHVVGESTEIVALGTPVEWDGDTGTTSELVTAVDATISSALEGLADEPNSIILGIPHSWTDKNGVLGVKKDFIIKIRKELELETMGYVIITDSILSYLKMQEGTPATSILIQVNRDELTLALVRLGRTEAIENIGRSEDIVEDVTEGIARFKVADNLPSRIILFNSMHNLDEIIQTLLSVDWPAQFNFLHIPKIEALAKDISIRALVVAGGSEVAKSLGLSISPPTPKEETVDPVDLEIISAEDIGFSPPPHSEKIDFIDPEDDPALPTQTKTVKTADEHHPFVLPKFTLPKIHLPKITLNFSSLQSHWWYLLGEFAILGVLIFSLVWVVPSAVLTIHVLPKELGEEVELTLSTTDSSINLSERIVPASIETISQSGEKMMETTGKKIVGDPSVGKVTIYNRTSSAKTFPKGTTLASGSLKFTLDQEVVVASKSAGSDYVDVPGKAETSVTATAIGADSNLQGGTEFTVMSFGKDSYVAKNDAPLSGGTSEEVQVVGKDDQKNLSKDLTAELLLTLAEQSTASSVQGSGIYLLTDSAKVDSVTYSAKVGETAKTLSASLTLTTNLLKYQTDDVTTLINSSIDRSVPAGYLRADLPSTVDLSASNVEENQSTVKGLAKVKVALLPQIDIQSLQKLVKGKKGIALENILATSVPGYVSAQAQVSPLWIPARLKSLPLNPRRIHINIAPSL